MNNSRLEGTLLHKYTPLGKYKIPELVSTDIIVGDGAEVPVGATITAHYTGALCADGTIFQSSHDFGDALTFSLDQVIEGWTKGVPGMKVGGTRRLTIPSAMAYGSARAAANIPPNSDLVFDIEVVAVK